MRLPCCVRPARGGENRGLRVDLGQRTWKVQMITFSEHFDPLRKQAWIFWAPFPIRVESAILPRSQTKRIKKLFYFTARRRARHLVEPRRLPTAGLTEPRPPTAAPLPTCTEGRAREVGVPTCNDGRGQRSRC